MFNRLLYMGLRTWDGIAWNESLRTIIFKVCAIAKLPCFKTKLVVIRRVTQVFKDIQHHG